MIDCLAVRVSAVKNDLLSITEIDGTSDLLGTDFTEEISPLSKNQISELSI